MDIRRFIASWNGILFILFIGIFIMFPAIKAALLADDPGRPQEISQVQLLVGCLAVIWALRAIRQKLRQPKDE